MLSALGLRAVGLVVNTILNGIAGALGWAMGALLPRVAMTSRGLARATALASLAACPFAFSAPAESLDGYAEWWRKGELLIVDGQRVRLAPPGRVQGRRRGPRTSRPSPSATR